MKLSDVFQGINVTPNTMFFMLFMGFFLWLYVIYFIRHHEPLANQVIGTGAGYSATAAADRNLVAGIRHAVPIRTGPGTGSVYVPIPGEASAANLSQSPIPGSAGVTNAPYSPVSSPVASFGSATPAPSPYAAPVLAPYAGSEVTTMRAYHLPIRGADGLRLKTVVNR
jgi:hypothetical protein